MLARGRHGGELFEETENAFVADGLKQPIVSSLKQVVWARAIKDQEVLDVAMAMSFLEMLGSSEDLIQCEGALGVASLFENWTTENPAAGISERIGEALLPLLYSDEPKQNYVAGWALFALGKRNAWTPPSKPDVLGRMFELWQFSSAEHVRSGLPQTIAIQQVLPRDESRCATIKTSDIEAVFNRYDSLPDSYQKPAALVVAWYSRFFDDAALVQRIKILKQGKRSPMNDLVLDRLLLHLGVASEEANGRESEK
jgi:hypothetical protein